MGANATQAMTAIDQGMSMFNKFKGMMDAGPSNSAEDQARLMETDARAAARDEQRRAKRDARRLRGRNEQERSGEHARWGGSNLAMSGSKALISDASRIEDMQEEDDILFEGDRDAEAVLQQGGNRANMLRINSGSSPKRSSLSLGSRIYGPRS